MSSHGFSLFYSLLGFAALAVATALTRTAWTRRNRPGATALATVGGLLTLGSIAFLFMFVYPARYQGLWIVTLYNVSGFAAVFAFLFAVRFTGRGRWLTRSVRAFLVLLPASLLIVSFLPFELGLGIEATSRAGLLAQRVIGLVSGVLTPLYAIAATILLWAAVSRDAVPHGQGLLPAGALLVLASAPTVSSAFAHSVWVFPTVLFFAGGGLLAALRRYRPFARLPVARPVVRGHIVDELSEPVVAVDRRNNVVDLNTAAEDTFDCEQSGVVGRPVGNVLDDAVVADAERRLIRVPDGVLSVVPETVGDAADAPLGTVLLFRDATDQRLRERQTRVLTELLSEVVGVQLTEIARLASSVDEHGGRDTSGTTPNDAPTDPEAVGAEIRRRTDLLLTVGKRAREMERALAATASAASTDLRAGIQTAATRSSIQAAECTVRATGASYTVSVPQQLLISGFAAVFDAVAIRDRSVTVSVATENKASSTDTGWSNDESLLGAGVAVPETDPEFLDVDGAARQRDPDALVTGDGHGYDEIVHVDIRTDSGDGNTEPVSDPGAEHPTAKLLSLIAVDAGGSVGVDGAPWEHLRITLPARRIRSMEKR
jgi:PAS domain-containing protein